MTPSPSTFPPLPCEKIVFRSLRPSWVNRETGECLDVAFFLREATEETPAEEGISVNTVSVESAISRLKKCGGVGKMHCGWIRSLGLEVVQDEETHAEILGAPLESENATRAHELADALAKQTRVIRVNPKTGQVIP